MADLYSTDALVWSERQSALLQRLARGERVNAAIDWANVIEEIEAMGRAELRACGSFLQQAIFHLVKLHLWPGSPAAGHWRDEVVTFLDSASRAYTPSMRQRIDLDAEYGRALRLARFAMEENAAKPNALPRERNPFTLDDLLIGQVDGGAVDRLVIRLSVPAP